MRLADALARLPPSHRLTDNCQSLTISTKLNTRALSRFENSEQVFFFTLVSTWRAEVQTVFGSSLNTDHRLIRWSLDPAASSLCRGSWWSKKATLCTISVWYFSTASGCSFFHPNIRTRWSQPAEARSFRSPRRHSWETPGLTSVTQSWSWKSQESAP